MAREMFEHAFVRSGVGWLGGSVYIDRSHWSRYVKGYDWDGMGIAMDYQS